MEKRERERKRDPWEEERQEFVTVRVWGEKKWESLSWEREGAKKLCFPLL